MTRFQKDLFDYHGGYLTYGKDRIFIARLKYGATTSKARWITFMVKNFTVEEWQRARARGMAPLTIMEDKGFILTHILRWLREGKIESYMGVTRAQITGRA